MAKIIFEGQSSNDWILLQANKILTCVTHLILRNNHRSGRNEVTGKDRVDRKYSADSDRDRKKSEALLQYEFSVREALEGGRVDVDGGPKIQICSKISVKKRIQLI